MKVLITGAGGQVGRALLRTAPAYATILACTHRQLDITDADSVASCVRLRAPDVIINAAAYTAVDRAESERDLVRRINTDGPGYLATAARDTGARFIHLSTDFVFDGTSARPYRPDAATNPLSVYGLTKRDGEDAVLSAFAERSLILRTAWVYAAQGHNFVHTMLRVMQASGSARVVADQIGTPTSAQSIAETIWRLIEVPEANGIHHWTDAGVASWYDFAVAIAEEAGALNLLPENVTVVPITTPEYPTPARRPPYSVLDTTSLTSLGFAPTHWRKRLRSVLGEINNG